MARFSRSPFYQAWDARVLEKWVKHGLRDLPTAIHPVAAASSSAAATTTAKEEEEKPVTLTTTRHQEVFTFSRPNYDYNPETEKPASILETPDLNPKGPNTHPFYRPEPLYIFSQLPHVRPSILYIFAGQSNMCTPLMMKEKLDNTGIGTGGSGGAAAGRVKSVLFHNKGHLLAQEAPTESADAAVEFLGAELERWRVEEEAFRQTWNNGGSSSSSSSNTNSKPKSQVEKMTVDERWLRVVGPPRARNANTTDGNSKPKL